MRSLVIWLPKLKQYIKSYKPSLNLWNRTHGITYPAYITTIEIIKDLIFRHIKITLIYSLAIKLRMESCKTRLLI